MNETTKQKITKALDYSGDDSGAYFNEGELEPLTEAPVARVVSKNLGHLVWWYGGLCVLHGFQCLIAF